MKIYLKILHVLSWIPLDIIKLALAIIGLVVIPFALVYERFTKEWPRWAWVWGNDEEGCPAWWIDRVSLDHWYTDRWPYWWWYAIRNPVNNSRFIFTDRPSAGIDTNWGIMSSMEPAKLLEANQQMAYRWVYSGPFAGYRCVWLHDNGKYSEIWFGWKVDSTVPGMGFTTQVRINRRLE